MTKFRRVGLILLAVIGVAGLWYLLYQSDQGYIPPDDAITATRPSATASSGAPSAVPAAAAGTSPAAAPAGTPSLPLPVSTPLPSGMADTEVSSPGSPAPVMAPPIVVEAVRGAIQKYGATFGGNPVGTNAEITRALNGDNPSHANFLGGLPGQHINSNGELVDSWGTPYFFHQLSSSDMEVRSAGPDHKMWSGDDIILK